MLRPSAAPALVPLDVAWSVGATKDHSGRRLIVLSIFTPMGEQHVFFDLLGAKEVSAAFEQEIAMQALGIDVADD
jgi:hypothetical protein